MMPFDQLQQFAQTLQKSSADKSNLWHTKSKPEFTQVLQMVYTRTARAVFHLARSVQSAVLLPGPIG